MRSKDEGWGLTTGRVLFASPSLKQLDWTLSPAVHGLLLDVSPSRAVRASARRRALRPRLPGSHDAINNCSHRERRREKKERQEEQRENEEGKGRQRAREERESEGESMKDDCHQTQEQEAAEREQQRQSGRRSQAFTRG